MSDPAGGMGSSLGVVFFSWRDASYFFSPTQVVSLYRNTTNSHLSISTKPGKNYLTVQELATGFSPPLQVNLFLFIEIPQIVINTKPGKIV